MLTVLGAMPNWRWSRWKRCCFAAARKSWTPISRTTSEAFHAELLASVVRRIVDWRVLHLIKMWLESPVEETDDRGRKTRTTAAQDNRRGIPQGSPISPQLASLYMRRFVLGWKILGLEQSLGSRIVTYADDLVILCRTGKAEEALRRLRELMGKLKLTVNEEKTRICRVPEGELTSWDPRSGGCIRRRSESVSGYRPSKKSIKRMVETIHALTARTGTWQETTELVGKLKLQLTWMGELLPSRASPKRTVRSTTTPLCGCAGGCASSTKSGPARAGPIHSHLYGHFGLVCDRAWARHAVGEGVRSCPRAGCGRAACPVR